jgi:hypothetical protein
MCVGGILDLMKKHIFGKKRFFFQFFRKSVLGLIDLGKTEPASSNPASSKIYEEIPENLPLPGCPQSVVNQYYHYQTIFIIKKNHAEVYTKNY